MYAWFYSGSPLVVYPLVALLLFLTVFLGVVLRTFGRRSERYEPVAALPLFDEELHESQPANGERHA